MTTVQEKVDQAVVIARAFHETYERLAPQLSYATRPESAVPWDEVPATNRTLMVATVAELLLHGTISSPGAAILRCTKHGNPRIQRELCATCAMLRLLMDLMERGDVALEQRIPAEPVPPAPWH